MYWKVLGNSLNWLCILIMGKFEYSPLRLAVLRFVLLTLCLGRIIISAVERYVRNVAEDVREIHTMVNKSNEHILNLDRISREYYEHAEQWHADIGAEIRATQDVALSIKDDIMTAKAGTELLNHRLDLCLC